MKNDIIIFHPELSEQNDGFSADLFEKLSKVEKNNFWFCNRNRLIIWALKCYFPHINNFMEIGCGTGFVLSGIEDAFPSLTLYGSEIFSNGLEITKKRICNAELFQMDARFIPFKNEFDTIGAFDVLEHIKDDNMVLNQMHDAVSSNGGILLTVPQYPWMWSRNDEYAHHVRRYLASDIKNKVELAGFKIVRMTSFVSIIFPLMMLLRLKQKKNYDPLSEFKISSTVNFLLGFVMKVESALIQNGFNFPVGGSLLVIAKKHCSV